MSNFETLLEELAAEEATLAKAMQAEDDGDGDDDDANIEAAAGGDEDGDGVPNTDDDEDEDDDEEDGEPLGKSMQVTLADGTVVQAFDGTAIVQALREEQKALQTGVGEIVAQSVSLLKSMRESLTEQRKEISELRKSLNALSAKGVGRKAKVVIHDLGGEPAASDGKPTRDEQMAKAMSAFDAGRINAVTLNAVDVSLRTNPVLPEHLAKAIS